MRNLNKLALPLALLAAVALPAAALAETASSALAAQQSFAVGAATIMISAGSSYKTAEVADGSLKMELGDGDAVILRTAGPNPISLENNMQMAACKVTRFRENQMVVTGPRVFSVTPGTVPCSDGGYDKDATPVLTMDQPAAGAKLRAGDVVSLMWSGSGKPVAAVTLALSLDGGKTYPQVLAEKMINNGFFSWTVGQVNAAEARLRLTGYEAGAPVTFAVSPAFAVGEVQAAAGTTETPGTTAVPATVAGSNYDPAAQLAASNSVDDGVGYVAPAGGLVKGDCRPGFRIKAEGSKAVYYCGQDGKRHAFPNLNVHATWFGDFNGVVTVTAEQLAGITLGKPVLYRPGARLVKLATDPKVYAVAQGGELRWVETEAAAVRLYGTDWSKKVDDVPDTFFMDYHVGESIK